MRNSSNCGGYAVVNIDDVSVSDYSTKNNKVITCKTTSDKEGKTLLLKKGKDNIITCTIGLDRELGSFNTPLTVKMSYMYVDVLESSIIVKEWEK